MNFRLLSNNLPPISAANISDECDDVCKRLSIFTTQITARVISPLLRLPLEYVAILHTHTHTHILSYIFKQNCCIGKDNRFL